jgi:hypothetical protein
MSVSVDADSDNFLGPVVVDDDDDDAVVVVAVTAVAAAALVAMVIDSKFRSSAFAAAAIKGVSASDEGDLITNNKSFNISIKCLGNLIVERRVVDVDEADESDCTFKPCCCF